MIAVIGPLGESAVGRFGFGKLIGPSFAFGSFSVFILRKQLCSLL